MTYRGLEEETVEEVGEEVVVATEVKEEEQ